MVGADETRRADRRLALDQPRTAVAAHVEKDMRRPVLVAGDEQRLAEAVVRHRHVWRR